MRSKLSVLLFLAAACTPAGSGTSDSMKATATDSSNAVAASSDDESRDAIGKLRSAWKDAADRKDSSAIAAFYSDDAVLATSSSPVATGRAEIEKTLGRMVNLTKIGSIDSKALVISGDEGYDYGTFSQDVTGPNGKSVTQNGYYVVTFHRQGDGSWKITHHVSTTPPTAG